MKVTTTETVKYRFAAVGILAALALVCTLAMGGCTTEKPAAENEDDLVAADQIAESEEVPTASEDAMLYDTQNTNAQDQAAASTPTAAEGANEATQTNNNSDSSDTNAAIEPNLYADRCRRSQRAHKDKLRAFSLSLVQLPL